MYEVLSFDWCILGLTSSIPISLDFLQFVSSSVLANAGSGVLQWGFLRRNYSWTNCLILGFPFGIEGTSYFDFLLQKQSVALNEGGSAADNLGTCFHISFQKQSEGLRI